ncbi:AI-2E family transporter [Microcoleus sp. FACHB-68]|uniref:AI-2E family transporter n=1 Tax=Microcoleus sp. FACHB-68 TaxID=2692826 RepID=UPI00168777F9|nr:AI-2E family transporter [Microcoleus sp. FACHB-68]
MELGKWIGLLALILSLYILWQIRQVVLLLFAAVLLATALNMLARRLQKFKLPRTIAVLLSVALFLAVLTGFFLLIVPPFVAQYKELTTTKLPQVIELLNTWRNQLRPRVPAQFIEYLPDVKSLTQQLQPIVERIVGRSFVFLSNSLIIIVNFLLVVVLTLMLLAQPMSYRKAFVRLFPSFYRRRVEVILDRCEIALGGWIFGALISMGVVGMLSFIGLSVLHVPVPLAQGILAGLLNFIPNIGPTLSVVLPMGISLLDAPWKAGAVFILYFLIQQFETNLLTPYVMAQQVSLLPAVTLLAQVFFATFFGFLGFLLALPLTVVGQVWVQEVLIHDVLDMWRTGEDAEGTETAGVVNTPAANTLPAESYGPVDQPVLPENPPAGSTQPRNHPKADDADRR